jgi:hypothetical protein
MQKRAGVLTCKGFQLYQTGKVETIERMVADRNA